MREGRLPTSSNCQKPTRERDGADNNRPMAAPRSVGGQEKGNRGLGNRPEPPGKGFDEYPGVKTIARPPNGSWLSKLGGLTPASERCYLETGDLRRISRECLAKFI